MTAESVKNVAKARQMSLEEAEKILGIDSRMSYEEVLKVRQSLSVQLQSGNLQMRRLHLMNAPRKHVCCAKGA